MAQLKLYSVLGLMTLALTVFLNIHPAAAIFCANGTVCKNGGICPEAEVTPCNCTSTYYTGDECEVFNGTSHWSAAAGVQVSLVFLLMSLIVSVLSQL